MGGVLPYIRGKRGYMGLAVFQAEPCVRRTRDEEPRRAESAPATPPREYSVYPIIIARKKIFVNRKPRENTQKSAARDTAGTDKNR